MSLSADGPTRDEALQQLRELVQRRMAEGAEIVSLEVAPLRHPFERFAGTLDPADPIVQQWEQAMEEYRRHLDENPDLP